MSNRPEAIISRLLRKDREQNPEHKIFDEALIAYRAWNVRELGAIIDFDLTAGPRDFEAVFRRFPQGEPTREVRLEMVNVLTELLSELHMLVSSSEETQHIIEFSTQRLEASYWFARRLAGVRVNRADYIRVGNGVEIKSTQDDFLDARREELYKSALKAKMPISGIKEMKAWKAENRLDDETAERMLRESAQDALIAVQNFTGEHVDLQYRINPVNEKAYYFAWSRTDYETGEFVCDQNFHPTKIWTPGKAEELGVHEIAEHLRRNSDWRNQINKGRMHPFIGQTVVHAPESVVEEGLALTLPHFVPDIYENLTPEGKFQVDASILKSMVWGNIHIKLNNGGISEEAATAYVRKYLPWEQKDEIERQIEDRTNNSTNQIYLLSYAIGARIFLEIIDTLNIKGRKQLLKDLSRKPFTPTQLINRAQELANNKNNKNHGIEPSSVAALSALI